MATRREALDLILQVLGQNGFQCSAQLKSDPKAPIYFTLETWTSGLGIVVLQIFYEGLDVKGWEVFSTLTSSGRVDETIKALKAHLDARREQKQLVALSDAELKTVRGALLVMQAKAMMEAKRQPDQGDEHRKTAAAAFELKDKLPRSLQTQELLS